MDILSTLFRQQSRKISFLIPDVVISEKHTDVLEITEHPVERPTNSGDHTEASGSGAGFIADHAYRRPSEVVMEIGFAGGGSLLDPVNTTQYGVGLKLSPREVYQKILDLQRSRQPFDVTTGKLQYSNMLIRTLEVTTDKQSENVLMAVLTLREVIMTRTQSINDVADKADMQYGVSTSAVQNTGVKNPVPVNKSILKRIPGVK